MLGVIASPGRCSSRGRTLHGTDLGWTFDITGGTSCCSATPGRTRIQCEALPTTTIQATFPLELPPSGLPMLTIATDPDAPNEFARIRSSPTASRR
jgi:hypothetical protein